MDPLIILAGPTAAGKTDLSILLAQRIGGEIISADSMQVYRHMDIGSAKIRPEEMRGVSHHLIDICEPEEEFNVVAFQKAAKAAVREITARGRIPIVTGGTGFYIQALLRDIDFTETAEDPAFRAACEREAEESGSERLHERLRAVDPGAAEAIHPKNAKRIIRALEYYHLTGTKISDHNAAERKRKSPYRFLYLVLNRERQELYRRIDLRVDRMMEEGLLDEVRALRARGCTRGMVSMQGLGYKELLAYLDGECGLSEAIDRIKRDTRHFAKRQLTWFKREPEAVFLNLEDFASQEELLARILKLCREKGMDMDL